MGGKRKKLRNACRPKFKQAAETGSAKSARICSVKRPEPLAVSNVESSLCTAAEVRCVAALAVTGGVSPHQ